MSGTEMEDRAVKRARPSVPAATGAKDDALARALDHLASLQHENGCWEEEMVWNTMLLSQYVIVQRIVGRAIAPAARERMIRYYRLTRTPEGAWGMHAESGPYVFFTALAYVALRLLGLGADDSLCAPARRWLREKGVLSIPSWGKLWLAFVGLYEYEGLNPIPPELFLIPERLPIHPNNFYCHTRYIYLGIAYLYGRRFRADLGPLTEALRRELYDDPYARIDFAAHRHDIAASDLYVRPSAPLRAAWDALQAHERVRSRSLRERALGRCLERIRFELRASRYQCLSPVNGLLNCLALHAADPGDPELARALDGVEAWKWQDEAEGIRYCGARSNAWDTAFALRATLAAPLEELDARRKEAVARGYAFLSQTQMREELEGGAAQARDPIVGGWCFSDGQHRWPVSDCTAEALSAVLAVHAAPVALAPHERITEARLRQAVQFILLRQNDDGGFGSYERRRAGGLLELVNPSEMYGSCMTERSYLECTASCVGALCRVRAAYPQLLRERIEAALDRAVALIRAAQRPDGSWAGFWGINFTYGTFHATEALRAAGVSGGDPTLERAAAWLVGKQRSDGGWGEHYTSALEERYVEHDESQVTMTAWALLALLEIDSRNPAIERGLAFLRSRQDPDGSWPREAQAGVFFGTAMLDYRLYKDVFPTWVLARAAAR